MSETPSSTVASAVAPTTRPSYRELAPPADLASVFTCLWARDAAARPAHPWRTIPNGQSELVWHSESRELVLSGPGQSVTFSGEVSSGFTVGLRVRPEHTAWFAGVPADEVVGRCVPLTTLHPTRWRATSSSLAEASTPGQAVTMLVDAIKALDLAPHSADSVVLGGLAHLRRTRRVGEVGARLNYSDREVRRRFRHATGLAPKTMQKVLRFQSFLALVSTAQEPRIPLALAAAQCGYADQAHLTRECVTWSGLAPRQLLLELASSCWPHHDHRASFADAGWVDQASIPVSRCSSTSSRSARREALPVSSSLQRNRAPK